MASGNVRPREASLLASLVARRFYLDDKRKNEIAAELGISRFKVARLIAEAHEAGIVRIYVDAFAGIDHELDRALQAAWPTTRTTVITSIGSDPDETGEALASVAARYIEDAVSEGDTLGLAWGSSVTRFSQAIRNLPRVTLVQMVGGVAHPEGPVAGHDVIRQIASKAADSTIYPLHAPLVVQNKETANALFREPLVKRTTDMYRSIQFAVIGIGSIEANQSFYLDELDSRDRAELADVGAIADICGRPITATGEAVATELNDRTVAIPLDTLRAIPNVIAIAYGPPKAGAIAAVLDGGYVDTLITDSQTAATLLAARGRTA